MSIHHHLRALTATAALAAMTSTASASVMSAPNTYGRETSGDVAEAPVGVTVPVIDDASLVDTTVRGIDEEALVLEFATTSGCTFDVEFTSDGAINVLGGNNYRCDWDAWLDANTVMVEATQVVSLWESEAWQSFFYYLADGDDEQGANVPDPGEFVDVEQGDTSCGEALANVALNNLACGGSILVGLASMGTGVGAIGGGVLAVAACGFYAKALINAHQACTDARNIVGFTVDDLVDIEDLVAEDVIVEVLDTEDFTRTYTEVEEWMTGAMDPDRCGAVIAACLDVYSSVEAAMAP